MAVRIIGNDYTGVTVDVNSDIWIIRDTSIVASVGAAFYLSYFDYSTIIIDGTLASQTDGISSSAGSNGNTVTVSATGSVTGESDGIELFGASNAVVNHGTVTGYSDTGIEVRGSNSSVSNFGSLFGVYAVFMSGDSNTFTNTGTVVASLQGITLADDNGMIVNHGTVIGEQFGVSMGGATGSTSSLVNTGVISINPSIVGALAVVTSAGDDIIVNSGEILGDIATGSGDDSYDGRGGVLTGAVLGGNGNDTYIIDDARTQVIEGVGRGTDEVQSLVSYRLGENFENLVLLATSDLKGVGNAENNTITGNIGDNLLRGRRGDDTLDGAGGDDKLEGGNGADHLLGGEGDDFLAAGKGGDLLAGDAGNDILRGGGGYDTFAFADGFEADIIQDFHKNNREKVDLSAVTSITNFADLSRNHMTQAGDDVRINAGGGDIITLLDFDMDALSARDFIF